MFLQEELETELNNKGADIVLL